MDIQYELNSRNSIRDSFYVEVESERESGTRITWTEQHSSIDMQFQAGSIVLNEVDTLFYAKLCKANWRHNWYCNCNENAQIQTRLFPGLSITKPVTDRQLPFDGFTNHYYAWSYFLSPEGYSYTYSFPSSLTYCIRFSNPSGELILPADIFNSPVFDSIYSTYRRDYLNFVPEE